MINTVLLKKISYRLIFPLGLGVLGLYSTGYLDDAFYLIGGVTRALRCGKVGIIISYKYINVINKFYFRMG